MRQEANESQVRPLCFLLTIKMGSELKKNADIKGKIKIVDYLCISKIIWALCIVDNV